MDGPLLRCKIQSMLDLLLSNSLEPSLSLGDTLWIHNSYILIGLRENVTKKQ